MPAKVQLSPVAWQAEELMFPHGDVGMSDVGLADDKEHLRAKVRLFQLFCLLSRPFHKVAMPTVDLLAKKAANEERRKKNWVRSPWGESK